MSDFITAIIQFISSVGFPIACCCFLLYQDSKTEEYNRKQQDELRKTIDNNTKSIKELANLIRGVMKNV